MLEQLAACAGRSPDLHQRLILAQAPDALQRCADRTAL